MHQSTKRTIEDVYQKEKNVCAFCGVPETVNHTLITKNVMGKKKSFHIICIEMSKEW